MNDSADLWLAETSGKVARGERVTLTTRDLLNRCGVQRRGIHVVADLRAWLSRHDLRTHPDFELAGYEEQLELISQDKAEYDVRLDDIEVELHKGRDGIAHSLRDVLEWFGYERRGARLINQLQAALDQRRLTTTPDFREVPIDGWLTFSFVREEARVEPSSPVDEVAEPDEVPLNEAAVADATFRIGTLISAGDTGNLISVGPDATINQAITEMLANDLSHLPVLADERRVMGILTWKVVTKYLALGSGNVKDKVTSAMVQHHEVSASDPFFTVLRRIIERNYAIVRGTENKIVGIVTKADLCRKFEELTEPFLLLGELENQVRKLIDRGGFTKAELMEHCGDGEREIDSLFDLTFGDYLRLAQNPHHWQRLELSDAIDRGQFCYHLDKVRQVRNDVMHFDPDSPSPTQVEALRKLARLLNAALSPLGR